jgi:carboxymethylenebutenolidase
MSPSDDVQQLSRRGFAAVGLGAGFALAVTPVAAATIATDAEGLDAGEVRIAVKGGEMAAYRAMPAAGGPFPILLVVQEVFGVHEHIRDVCRRLAKEGWLAIAPDLFARQGDVAKITDMQRIVRDVVSRVPDRQVIGDLDATVAWAEASGKADIGRLGITGFGWGGRIVWLYAADNPRLKAGVAWYGRLVGDPTPNTPRQPINVADELKAPVLGLYGGADQGIPLGTIERMRKAAEASGQEVVIHVYDGAPHAFFADYRPSYREDAARDGWQRCLAWLRQHGAG